MPPKAATAKKKTLTFEQFTKELQQEKIAPLYFFHALERASRGGSGGGNPFNQYLLDRAVSALQQAVVSGNLKDFNYNLFVGGETPIEKLVQIAETYPMMRKRRLILLKEADKLVSEDWRKMAEYMVNPAPSTCLALVSVSPPSGSKNAEAAAEALAKNASWVKFAPLAYPREAKPFISDELKTRGVSIDSAALDLMVEAIGVDLLELMSAVDQLCIYIGERKKITQADVEACTAIAPLETIWDLHDGLATLNTGKALAALEQLTRNAKVGDYLFITGSLTRLAKDLLEMRLALDAGKSPSDFAGSNGSLSFPMKKKLDQARRLNAARINLIIRKLHECDRKLKSSRLSNKSIMEEFVIASCAR